MAQWKPLILKLGKKAQAIVGDVLQFPDMAIFDSQINIGSSSDSTSGNIKYDGTDFLGRDGAIWKSLTKLNLSDITELVSSTTIQTSSLTPVIVTDLTTIPLAGTYKVEVSIDCSINNKLASSEFGLYQNNTLVLGTRRVFGGNFPFGTISIVRIVTMNGTDPLQMKFQTLTSGVSVSVDHRTMILTKVN